MRPLGTHFASLLDIAEFPSNGYKESPRGLLSG